MISGAISWIFFGLVVGAIARYAVPQKRRMGIVHTMLLGVVGSFVGGFFGYIFAGGSPFQASGWLGSIIGAIVILAVNSQHHSRYEAA